MHEQVRAAFGDLRLMFTEPESDINGGHMKRRKSKNEANEVPLNVLKVVTEATNQKGLEKMRLVNQ